MSYQRLVFSQVLDYVPKRVFRRIVEEFDGHRRVRSFSCWDQFLCLAFAQVTFRESLRDVETCLRSNRDKLHLLGLKGHVARSTLADANESRDWRIYEKLGMMLIKKARELYASEPLDVDFSAMAYAFDSTTIDLCLSLFPWAKFRETKSAVKVHTLLDLRGKIPSFAVITAGKVHDVKALDWIAFEAGAMYVMDRGYLDFRRLYRMTQSKAFFIIRAKRNTKFRRIKSREVDKSIGLIVDQTIKLTGTSSPTHYPDALRRIRYIDQQTGKRFTFLTNNFDLRAIDVATFYKSRWHVELFFKWIKQHLRIKAFFGTSENAVKTQIWIAISVYTLVAILKKELRLPHSLYTILQVLSIVPFEKTPILSLFSKPTQPIPPTEPPNQLSLFGS